MEALVKKILDELANDPQVHASNINVELTKVGSLFKKKTALHVFGSVGSEEERDTVIRSVKKSAGADLEIMSDLAVKHHEVGTTS